MRFAGEHVCAELAVGSTGPWVGVLDSDVGRRFSICKRVKWGKIERQ